VSDTYEVYSIEKKKFLAVQLLPATKLTNPCTHVVDVMRWVASAGIKSKFAS
jgi:hypothetical protein